MEYRRGNWRYTDTYHGSFMAPGKEQVGYSTSTNPNQPKENYLPVWEMFYAGGMMPLYWQNKLVSDITYKQLKKALSFPPVNMPIRGPLMFGSDETGIYTFKIDGDITLFGGTEEIWLKSDSINNLTEPAYQANQMVRTFRQIISGTIIVYDHAKV
jgi:hypothetical protein